MGRRDDAPEEPPVSTSPLSPASRTALGAGVLAFALVLALAPAASVAEEPPAPDASWRRTVAAIDAQVRARLAEAKVAPAPLADDAEFLRRVSLDLHGRVPTADEAAAFANDRSADKRARKIEQLLADPAYADYWGTWWYRTLTGMSSGAIQRMGEGARLLRGPNGDVFKEWLEARMAENTPYDKFTEQLLSATGRSDENGATGFYLRWEGKPANLAGAVAKTFLGVRIQCAQCHDHKFEPTWGQKDFQGMAAFFALSAALPVPEYVAARREAEMEARREKEKAKDEPGDGMTPPGEDGKPGKPKDRIPRNVQQLRLVVDVKDFDASEVRRPRGGDAAKAPERLKERAEYLSVQPKFWMDKTVADVPGISRRYLLARWVTSPQNPYFAKALANRYWAHFLGRGLVHPVDDFGSFNHPSHPELLDLLAQDFQANGYDLKRLARILTSTEAYQRTSRWEGAEEPDPALFARAPVRPLSTEQLYNSIMRASGADRLADRLGGRRQGYRQKEMVFSAFSFLFDDDEMQEKEDFAGSIPQGLFLLNGQLLQAAVGSRFDTTVGRTLREEKTEAGRVERLYLAAYGRPPDAQERATSLGFLRRAGGEAQAYEDLFWVLVNSAEFMSNH
jgi:hypothetical protein